MLASDIIWGGINKCEVLLSKNISLSEGCLVDLAYDYIQERYVVKYNGDTSTLIQTSESNKEILDNIFLSSSSVATLIRVVDIEEMKCIFEIKVFKSMTYFNSLQGIKICIDENVIRKMRIRERENVILSLNESFLYNDMVFVKGYGKKGSNFTLLSNGRALHIVQENRVYTATNIVKYDKNKADWDAVHILRGNIEFINSSQGATISREVSSKMNQIISGNEYIDIWDAYNDLERLFMFKEATEHGILKYSSYKCELTNTFEYCFSLEGENFDNFPEDTQMDCTEDDRILKLEQFKNAEEVQLLRSIPIGTFSRIEEGKCYIIDSRRSAQSKFPSQGYLFYSVVGDAVRLARREAAQRKILTLESPISNLASIIDKGIGSEKQLRNEIPITNMLKRKFGNKYDFNIGQKRAIEVAINTPDIALILGPPGTGKTTVIKAIVARFEEYYKKHNDKAIPAILVTSFQHEAVENAIMDMDGNGLPSNRLGGRRNEESKQTESIRQWRDMVTIEISKTIGELGINLNESNLILKDKIYAWIQKGKNSVDGIELLNEVINGNRFKISIDLLNDINRVLVKSQNITVTSVILKDWEVDEEKEIENILISQRLTQVSYEDDGKKHAFALKTAILQDQIKNNQDVKFIDDVLGTKGKDTKKFNIYVSKIEEIKSKYIKNIVVNEVIQDVATIEHLLKRLDNELNKSYLNSIENRDEAIAFILQQYVEDIQDEMEVSKIVEGFSNINAATCQQSMELGKNAKNRIYDLVIIDEAARANPLDLLIPMSMGRQIILVGDHKQLPHMLDPEVTKQFENDEKLNDLGVLKISLFERLFNMFEIQTGNIKRTARLKYQYRMNSNIEKFVSENFYEDYPLDSSYIDDSVKLANIGMYNDKPLVWINADKDKYGMEQGKRSKYRTKEAKLIIDEVKKILDIDYSKTIGIITFYSKQKEVLQEIISKKLTEDQQNRVNIGSVDAFQGKEFDIVFLSCVRANNVPMDNMRKRVGHVSDINRLCVSFTRAKQLLVVVGDKDTVECVPAISNYLKKCTKEGVGYYE